MLPSTPADLGEGVTFFVSSSMADKERLQLRFALGLVGLYNHPLMRFTFIEQTAATAGPTDEMRRLVRDCHAVIMILHNETDDAFKPVRPGIETEYRLALEFMKPILLFHEKGFEDDEKRASFLWRARRERDIFTKSFSTEPELFRAIELSIYTGMLGAYRGQLFVDGQKGATRVALQPSAAALPSPGATIGPGESPNG